MDKNRQILVGTHLHHPIQDNMNITIILEVLTIKLQHTNLS